MEHVERTISVAIVCPQCGARREMLVPLLDPLPVGPLAMQAASEVLHWAVRQRLDMCACWAEDGNDGSDDGRAPATSFEMVDVEFDEADGETAAAAADFLQASPPIPADEPAGAEPPLVDDLD